MWHRNNVLFNFLAHFPFACPVFDSGVQHARQGNTDGPAIGAVSTHCHLPLFVDISGACVSPVTLVVRVVGRRSTPKGEYGEAARRIDLCDVLKGLSKQILFNESKCKLAASSPMAYPGQYSDARPSLAVVVDGIYTAVFSCYNSRTGLLKFSLHVVVVDVHDLENFNFDRCTGHIINKRETSGKQTSRRVQWISAKVQVIVVNAYVRYGFRHTTNMVSSWMTSDYTREFIQVSGTPTLRVGQ